MKICSKCGENKDPSQFFFSKTSKDGLYPWCKPCGLAWRREWKLNNKDKIANNDKTYKAKNPEKLKARKQRYYQKTKSKVNESLKLRKTVDIDFKIRCNLRIRLNKAVKNNQKTGSAVKDLGCSIEEFKLHIEAQFVSGMSWENYGNKPGQWSFDHILPLSRFDLQDREQFLKACHFSNIQPMWHVENIRKGKN